jgi:preprotein translocase subunit SecD
MVAGIVGFILISLFMLLYYRLPGFVAVLAIITYGVITLAIYKLLPVTLTLPGIAGLMLSTGGALDANILIFERLKEELRGGRKLDQALTIGWRRAWPSIRDSNVATLITSIIIFVFGSAFGASIVKGFALTLAIGIIISLFGALVVTRAFLYEVLNIFKPTNYSRWFGI